MDEKKFKHKYLPAIKQLLSYVLASEYCDFYKDLYKGLDITADTVNSYADFQKIPVITKDDLLKVPLPQRMFVPEDMITGYTISSGTTSNNRPLVTPTIDSPDFEYSEYNCLERNGAKKVLIMLPLVRAVGKAAKMRVPYLTGDPQKLDLSANIAQALGADAIISTPTILYLFTKKLVEVGFDMGQIKQITISTEYCTEQKAAYFRKMYPAASLRISYGSSEIGGVVGYRCKHLYTDPPNVFHLLGECFTEFQEDKSEANGYGDMIYTHLTDRAFPLIRYRTGDIAKKVDCDCECGQDHLLYLRGKADLDVMRISGGLLHTQAIANALAVVEDIFESNFRMNVNEVNAKGTLYTELTLELIVKDPVNLPDIGIVSKVIQDNLYLSSEKTLTDFVDAGIFKPLKIRLVTELPTLGKSKNIISHLI